MASYAYLVGFMALIISVCQRQYSGAPYIKKPRARLTVSLIYQAIIFLLYQYYVSSAPSDMYFYFNEAKNLTELFIPSSGRELLIFISHIFYRYFDFGFIQINVAFATLGLLAITLIDVQISYIKRHKVLISSFLTFIVFFPSFRFWLVTISKEVVYILLIGFIASQLRHILFVEKKRLVALYSAVYLLPLLRFYLIFPVITGVAGAIIPKIARTKPFFIFIVIYVLAALAIVLLDRYLQGFDGSLINFLEHHLSKFDVEIVYFDTLFFNVATYLFQPFTLKSIYYYLFSIESLAILWLVVYMFIFGVKNNLFGVVKRNAILLGLLLYVLVLFLMLGLFTVSDGIILRQKWMVLTPLFILFVFTLNYKETKNQ